MFIFPTVAMTAGGAGFVGGAAFIVIVLILIGRRRRRKGGYEEKGYYNGSNSCYYDYGGKKEQEMEWDDDVLNIVVNPIETIKSDQNNTTSSLKRLNEALNVGESEEEEDDEDEKVEYVREKKINKKDIGLEWDDGVSIV